VKGWLLPISVMLGLVGVAAVLLWNLVDWPAAERLQGGAPPESVGTSTPSSGIQPVTETGAQAVIREARPQSAMPVPAPAHLEPLFAALALYRPPELLEAPDFTLPDLDGRPVRLRDLRGKLVFLNIWATWCPPCRLEMPSMERLYQTFKETAFAMLAVSIDRQGVEAVKPFMAELQLTLPVLLDQKSEVARQYGLRGLPMTYLIDPDGRLIGAAVGGRDWFSAEAKALIAGLLRQATSDAKGPAQAGRTDSR
jgi:peroxiredoxin